MMTKIWHTIGDFFQLTFQAIDILGNNMNYFYVTIIFCFLVLWVVQMLKHRKNNEEHASF